jgi:hypothetical protein
VLNVFALYLPDVLRHCQGPLVELTQFQVENCVCQLKVGKRLDRAVELVEAAAQVIAGDCKLN